MISRQIALLLLLLLCAADTQQNAVRAFNYTSDILRLAKSSQMMAYLDERYEACENFYNYSCGKWSSLQPASARFSITSYLAQLTELYDKKSAEMLKEDRFTDKTVDRQLKDFYRSCIARTNSNEPLNMKAILQVVNFEGGWPKVEAPSWYESGYDWLKTIADLKRNLGVDILVGLQVIQDFKERELYRIMVGAPQLALSKQTYANEESEELRVEYRNNISHILQRHFSEMSQQWAAEVAQQVVQLEQQMAKGLPNNEALTVEQTTRQRYPSDLKTAYGSYVDLSRYMRIVFNDTVYMEVYETPEDYMTNLVELIKHTPKLTIANYTMWRVLQLFEAEGVLQRQDSHNWCVRKINEYFPQQLQNMFHRNYNDMQTINDMQSVWADIKHTFRAELQKPSQGLSWLSLETRQRALLKLEAMHLEIASYDSQQFEQQMLLLSMNSQDFTQNFINILQWNTQRSLEKISQKPSQGEQLPQLLTPLYKVTENKIIVPIKFLQSRFFWDESYPTALKYSTMGFLLAQQMLKGFDAHGRRYDKNGYQRSWWDASSEQAYDAKAECLAEQYTADNLQQKKVADASTRTLNAIIVNTGALNLAYLAYQKWWDNIKGNQKLANSEVLPKLGFSQNQLFFLAFTQLHCTHYYNEEMYPEDMPESVRVLQALRNSPEFAEEFSCEVEDAMHPKKKCKLY